MLDGTVSDRVEATSLTYALDKVDIYSASWGPSDDGRTVEGPGKLTRQALYRGVTEVGSRHTTLFTTRRFVNFREEKEKEQFTYGRLAMVVAVEITAMLMDMFHRFIRCLSEVLLNRAAFPGTEKSARQIWLSRTAAERTTTRK